MTDSISKVCPSPLASYDPMSNVTTFLTGTTFTQSLVPLWNPGSTITLSYGLTQTGSQDQTAKIFSVGSLITGTTSTPTLSGRYTLPVAGGDGVIPYWIPSTRSVDLNDTQKSDIYTKFTTTPITSASNSPMMITTLENARRALTGTLSDSTVSVSYDLLYSLKYEFCHYLKVYGVLIQDFVTVQRSNLTEADKEIQLRPIVNNLSAVKLRLVDLIAVATYIGTKQTRDIQGMNTEINQFLSQTKSSVEQLNKNAQIIDGKDKQALLRTRQLEYSEEKNAYANQMLAMYGFANLIAIGLLFYIYKS